MGKAVFRDTSVNGLEQASDAKVTGKIRIKKTRSNLKLNIIIFLLFANLVATSYLIYQLLGRHY